MEKQETVFGGGSNTCDVCGEYYNNGKLHRCSGKMKIFPEQRQVNKDTARVYGCVQSVCGCMSNAEYGNPLSPEKEAEVSKCNYAIAWSHV